MKPYLQASAIRGTNQEQTRGRKAVNQQFDFPRFFLSHARLARHNALCCSAAARGTGVVLSVIIATQDSERVLVPTLATLVSGAAAGIVREVIVADAGSRDATAEIADIAGCELAVSQAPLAKRLRDAASAARATWLMFLRPGTVLDTNWVDETARFVERAERQGKVESRTAVFRMAPAMGIGSSAVVEA